MRILSVTPGYYPFLEMGGPSVKVRAISEGLVRRGHSVTVITPWYGKKVRTPKVELGGVDVRYLRPLLRYRATTLNAGVVSFCRHDLRDFDAIHIYGIYDLLGPTIAHFASRLGIPYILEPLGMLRPIDRNFRMKRLWHRIFGAPLIQHASFVIATSRQEENELLEEGVPREKAVIRYNGLELSEFANLPPRGVLRRQWGVPENEPIVLFLGRLIPRKGLDLLIPAFAAACPDRGRLVIAGPEGEANYVKQMRDLAVANGVESRTIFAGPLYGDQQKAAFVDCDIFALPSRYENFANSVAEAIACSRPVIISDTCGISEFVNNEVGLVIRRDIPTLAESLRKLLTDEILHRRFRDACPTVANRLSWKSLLIEQENLYTRAVSL